MLRRMSQLLPKMLRNPNQQSTRLKKIQNRNQPNFGPSVLLLKLEDFQSHPNMLTLSSFGTELVRILVGPSGSNLKNFSVHKTLLRSSSPFSKKAFGGLFLKPRPQPSHSKIPPKSFPSSSCGYTPKGYPLPKISTSTTSSPCTSSRTRYKTSL